MAGSSRSRIALRSAISHLPPSPRHPSRVERAGVHHRGDPRVAGEDNEEVGDHGRLALVVELDDLVTVQPLERLLHHGDRALHDLLAGRDDRRGLLALQHGLGDLGGVGPVSYTHLTLPTIYSV